MLEACPTGDVTARLTQTTFNAPIKLSMSDKFMQQEMIESSLKKFKLIHSPTISSPFPKLLEFRWKAQSTFNSLAFVSALTAQLERNREWESTKEKIDQRVEEISGGLATHESEWWQRRWFNNSRNAFRLISNLLNHNYANLLVNDFNTNRAVGPAPDISKTDQSWLRWGGLLLQSKSILARVIKTRKSSARM